MPKTKFIVKIDGLTPYPIEFDASSWSFGDNPQAVTSHFEMSPHSSITKFWIVRPSDQWSSLMRQAASSGQSFELSLIAQTEKQGRLATTVEYSFSGVVIDRIRMSGNPPDIAENIGFDYGKVDVEYGSHQPMGQVD
jgi:type VI protein secretion system component Hcp